jgi:hypothetical protein
MVTTMGWVVFWAAVIVLLLLAWFVPALRRSSRGAPDGPDEAVLREAERHRGASGGWGGIGGGGWGH